MSRKVPPFIKVCSGPAGEVWLSDGVFRAYRRVKEGTSALEVKQATQLERYMREFCESVRSNLSDLHYKREETYRHKDGRSATVFAFKPFKLRIYGVTAQMNDKKVFFGLGIDPAKKQDKANRTLLDSTSKAFFALDLQEVEVRDEDEIGDA